MFTDGRTLPEATEPSWLGYSVGRWDGDTFVVETTGFRDGGWLDTRTARPHSDALRVTERFRRVDFGRLELTITIDDPKAYLKPWTITAPFEFLPDIELVEVACDGHRTSDFVGTSGGSTSQADGRHFDASGSRMKCALERYGCAR